MDLMEGLEIGSAMSLLSPARSSTHSQGSEARSAVGIIVPIVSLSQMQCLILFF